MILLFTSWPDVAELAVIVVGTCVLAWIIFRRADR